jgi:hypothetical protein
MSDEYHEYMNQMRPALDHHYANNRHHPEYYTESKERYCTLCGQVIKNDEEHKDCNNCEIKTRSTLKGMTLVDLSELVADWKSAAMRQPDGDAMKSLEMNQIRFGYGDELKQILRNTLEAIENGTL